MSDDSKRGTPPDDAPSSSEGLEASRARSRPLLMLCAAMGVGGLVLAFGGLGSLFDQWDRRGIQAFGELPDGADYAAALATFRGVLGASQIGKWIAAAFLTHHALSHGRAWARRALIWGIVAFGLFEFLLAVVLGMTPGDASGPLLVAIVGAIVLFRVPVGRSEPAASIARPRAVAWLEGFAWLNVALGLALVPALHSDLFAFYRGSMASTFFGETAIPSPLWPWLDYAYAGIGAAFAAHFALLALATRAQGFVPWVRVAWWTSVGAWFVLDSLGCSLHGAWFNIVQVNLPAFGGAVVLCLWAGRRSS